MARKLQIPVIDYQAEILRRRPKDWDGRLEKFGPVKDVYEVPTLISGDGVHPSNPKKYQNDFSQEALDGSGYNLAQLSDAARLRAGDPAGACEGRVGSKCGLVD